MQFASIFEAQLERLILDAFVQSNPRGGRNPLVVGWMEQGVPNVRQVGHLLPEDIDVALCTFIYPTSIVFGALTDTCSSGNSPHKNAHTERHLQDTRRSLH